MPALKYFDGTDWQYVSTQGPPGADGPAGPQGPAGAPGSDLLVASDSPLWTPAGWCDTATLTANVWKTLPTKSGANPGRISPPSAFVENADGSITIVEAGVYTVTGTAMFSTAGNQALSVGNTPNAQNYWDMGQDTAGSANSPHSVSTTVKVNAGAKVYFTAYNSAGGSVALYYAAIVRETGVKGDKGDPGGTVGAHVFTVGSGALTSIAQAWKTLPFGSTNIEPPGAFVVNADNSVSVTVAGYYDVAAVVNGTWGTVGQMAITLSKTPTTEALSATANGSAQGGPYCSVSSLMWLVPGERLYVNSYCNPTQNCRLQSLTVARSGGPQGAKGDPGGPVPVGGAVDLSLVKKSSADGDVQWARPKGAVIDIQRAYGATDAYKVVTNGQRFTVNAAGTQDLILNYTPTEDCWWEVALLVANINKTDAAYHYAYANLVIAPPDLDGVNASGAIFTQHSTVDQFGFRFQQRLFRLQAGIAYQAYGTFVCPGGTWSYYQGWQYLGIEAKAFKR